ncbi:hypothetical protein BDZ91DRAFT_615987, partial [Kalaharituber pfeilii]
GNALMAACLEGNSTIVKMLLDAGAEVKISHNPTAYVSGNPLLAAIISGNVETVKILLDKGADVNA